jgi:hypothetical protein
MKKVTLTNPKSENITPPTIAARTSINNNPTQVNAPFIIQFFQVRFGLKE